VIEIILLTATFPRNHSIADFPLVLVYVFVPVLVVSVLDGMLIGIFIIWIKRKLSTPIAISFGVAVGSTLALISNYIVWLNSSPIEKELFYPSLLGFIIYSFTDTFRSVFFVNIFFLPIAFSIFVSAYIGLKMNNLYIRETTPSTEE
jgi:hypothetical protein